MSPLTFIFLQPIPKYHYKVKERGPPAFAHPRLGISCTAVFPLLVVSSIYAGSLDMTATQASLLALATVLGGIPGLGQAIPADEMRITSRPYTPPPTSVFRVQSNLVEVGVVVRDKKGRPVSGLTQSDFQLLDNGKPHEITFFSAESAPPHEATPASAPITVSNDPEPAPPRTPSAPPRPRYIALFFDDESMEVGDLAQARNAAEQFIQQGALGHGDKVGIFTSSNTVTQDFTADTKTVAEALAQLRPHPGKADEGPGACPPMTPYQAYLIERVHDDQALDLAIEQGIVNFCLAQVARPDQVLLVQRRADQVLFAAEQFARRSIENLGQVIVRLGQARGQRILVLVSSGVLSSTLQRELDKLAQTALGLDIVINSLDAIGLVTDLPDGANQRPSGRSQPGGIRGDLMGYAHGLRAAERETSRDLMASLANATGGTFFHNSNNLGLGFQKAFAVPEARYVLGFSPQDLKPDGRLHALKVKVMGRDGLTVDARRGYFAPGKTQPAKSPSTGSLDAAVRASGSIADFPVDTTAQIEKLATGEQILRVKIHMDVRKLPFQHRADRSVEKLRMVTALFDQKGEFLYGVEAVIDLALKDATRKRIFQQGLDQSLTLRAPAGSYNLREVIQEAVQGRIAALSNPVVIP